MWARTKSWKIKCVILKVYFIMSNHHRQTAASERFVKQRKINRLKRVLRERKDQREEVNYLNNSWKEFMEGYSNE
jgi:hypothetical protein